MKICQSKSVANQSVRVLTLKGLVSSPSTW
jgi:hypothetical protein